MTEQPAVRTTDVLVVGGGPAGAATAYWAAKAGHDVVMVERKVFPREKTCGDGLTPRAVHELAEMGLEETLGHDHHRFEGLRTIAHGITLELPWPEHPVYPSYGYVVRRRDLDPASVAENAESRPAPRSANEGAEATEPLMEDGRLVGAVVARKDGSPAEEVRARYVVVADGSHSRFGRALGTSRNRRYPQGMAIRTYYESPMHDDPWIESALDVRDRQGKSLPGYGWVFPVGDGTINVGIGLLSTFKDWKSVNTSHLMEEYGRHSVREHWGIEPERADVPGADRRPAADGRLGRAEGGAPGPTYLIVGDAAGSVNPFNGEGIDYAYETGRLAADVLDEALRTGSSTALQRYPETLEREYGLYFKVARLFVKLIGRPALMRELTRTGMHSRTLMEWVLRIMANLLRPD